jgi:hypothetical protein
MTGHTRSVPHQVFIEMNVPLRRRPGGTGHPFAQTCGSQSHMFVQKINKYPAVASESSVHLVKRSICMSTAELLLYDRRYTVPPPEVAIASGRVEDYRSLSQKIHKVNFL